MKILALILLFVGAIVAYGAKKIVPYVFKNKEITDSHIIIAKFLGFGLVLTSAVIIFNL